MSAEGASAESIQEASRRVKEYLAAQTVLLVPFSKREHYTQPLTEWGPVVSKFSQKTAEAIEEAEKCFALGRNTACVFHLMAVMNEGLTALAKYLGAKVDTHMDTWEDIIGKIQAGINTKRSTMTKSRWKKLEPFYDEALSDLRSVKNAWRNPTMHFTRTYDEPQAAKARERVRDFMLHIAGRIRGPKH